MKRSFSVSNSTKKNYAAFQSKRAKYKAPVITLTVLLLAAALVCCTGPATQESPAETATLTETSTTMPSVSKPEPEQAMSAPSAAAPPSAPVRKKYSFALVYGGPHPYFAAWTAGAQAAASELQIPIPNVTGPEDWNQDEQNILIDGLLAGGVSGLGLFVSDQVYGNKKISELTSLGIPVVALGGLPAMPTKAKFCYAPDGDISTQLATQALVDELKRRGKKSGNIVHLTYGLADTSTQKRKIPVKEVLNDPKNAGFVLYKELPDTDAEEPAKKAVSAMFETYIHEVDGIICTGYINSQVLAKYITERKDNEGVVVMCNYDSAEVLNAIRKGYVFTSYISNSWATGYVGIHALKLFADGYTWKKGTSNIVNSGSFLLKKTGFDQYDKTRKQIAYDFVSTMKDIYFDPPAH